MDKTYKGCQHFEGVMSLPPAPPLSTSSYHLIFNYFCPNIGGNYIINHIKIAELISDEMIIGSIEDGLDLVGNLFFQGFDRVVIHEKNITPHFFVLKNKIAGEILQKFSTYRISLAIVGDFSEYTSKSLRDFIVESNNHKHINFVTSTSEAIELFASK